MPTATALPAAPAANADAPFWDLFAAARVLSGVFELPVHRLDQLVDRIEAQRKPVEFMTVRELMQLVLEVQP
ncbi:MAG: hypothetical protein J0M21_00085 [Xanthomonadales bacterium]|nr:hypothetical protein [Xanthomonadales bacterium]